MADWTWELVGRGVEDFERLDTQAKDRIVKKLDASSSRPDRDGEQSRCGS